MHSLADMSAFPETPLGKGHTFIPSFDKGESDHPAHSFLVLSESQWRVGWGKVGGRWDIPTLWPCLTCGISTWSSYSYTVELTIVMVIILYVYVECQVRVKVPISTRLLESTCVISCH